MRLYTLKHLLFRLFLFALMAVFFYNGYAQTNILSVDSISSSDHIYHSVTDYKSFLDNIKKQNSDLLDKKLQKQYTDIINEKNTALIEQLNSKGFLFDNTIYPYLNSIFTNILLKNGLDKNQFHFFIDRSASINAYTYEDGTVVCDLGLLSIIQNESQLTMVFCHELGHYLLKHTNTSIVTGLEMLNSDEMKEKVKEIQKEQYNTKEQLEKLMLTNVFDRRKHNRLQESAADSLGMILFCKTNYNSTSVPLLFDFLDSSENETSKCTMQSFFTNEGTPINENWLKPVKKMSFGEATKKEIIDSLKTHPDCAKRKIVTQLYFNTHPQAGPDFYIGNAAKLTEVKDRALFDEAGYCKDNDNLGLYLYELIQNDTQFPSTKYIKTEIFNTLLTMCMDQKKHELYKVVSRPYIAASDKDEYAKLLKVLDMIDLAKLVEITVAYYDKNKPLINISKESLTNLNQLKTTQL